jgi:hypothetical protein
MKPCKECPFSRTIEPGNLGGSAPEVYVGQIVLPFWLPCHCSANYRGKETDVNEVSQCAGAAIMRANLGVHVPRALLSLPPGPDAFESLAEFYAHHAGISIDSAREYLTPEKVRALALTELNDPAVRVQAKQILSA